MLGIDQVHRPGFANENNQVRAGNHHRPARSEVKVVRVHVGLVMRRKPIGDDQRAVGNAQLDERIAEVEAAGVLVERAVAGRYVNVAVSVGGGPHAAAPNSTTAIIRPSPGIGRSAKNGALLEAGRVVAEQPAVVVPIITVRTEGHVDRVAEQQKAGAAVLK